jgi:CheY-like chemotaxis protein
MFKETFVRVKGFTSVEEGIQELLENEKINSQNPPYSIIFIDYNLPGISGYEGG